MKLGGFRAAMSEESVRFGAGFLSVGRCERVVGFIQVHTYYIRNICGA